MPRPALVRRVDLTGLLLFALALAPLPAAGSGNGPILIPDDTARALELDFPALHIGVAEYPDGPTGVTVFYFPSKAKIAVDARGGAPGTMNTDYLRLGYDRPVMDAVVFAGGSWYGLSAGTGVAEGIKESRANAGAWQGIAGVVSAIIFDLGERRANTITPDAALGKAALAAARPGRFPLGAHGAGRLAMQGSYFARSGQLPAASRSGQGGAFRQVGATRIAVFTVVNALGTIVDRAGRVVRCGEPRGESGCGAVADLLATAATRPPARPADAAATRTEPGAAGPTETTTITLVVTNQKMPFADLERLAVQVHSSMARGIQPFATENDGDVLYAATTSEVERGDLSPLELGVIASEVAWDAVLASVPAP